MSAVYRFRKKDIKSSGIKILPTTERLFERICYLTKLSLKSGGGTEVWVDPFDSSNCNFLCVCERTIRNHLKMLCELGVIRRVHEGKHVYELHSLVLSDILHKNRHSFYRIYLKKINTHKIEVKDNLYLFPISVEKNTTSHIYANQGNKSNKSSAQGRENLFEKGSEERGSPSYTVHDAMEVVKEELGESFWNGKLNKDIGELVGGARKRKFKTLEVFRAYCKRIRESWIYWSGRIKNKLLYILKFNVIDAFLPKEEVLEGNYEMKRVNENQAEDFVLQNQLMHILDLDEEEECKIFRKRILDTYGAILYKTWLTQVNLGMNEYGKIFVKEYPNGFVKDYVEDNFLK